MKKLLRFIFIFSLPLLFFSCLMFQENSPQARLRQLKKQKARIDKIVKATPEELKYYCRTKGMEKPFYVKAKNYWPASSNIEMSYGLLYDKKGKLIFAYEEPFAPMGEYTINYSYYFDEEGHTVIFDYYCGFFNSVCAGNSIAKENRTEYFSKDFSKFKEEYSLMDESGKKLDSVKCDFPYRTAIHLLHGVDDFKIKNGIE